jgi:protoheme IX farnesyltransferase
MATAELPTRPVRPVPIAARPRLADFAELTKPRIAVMALVTVGVGYLLGAEADARLVPLVHVLVGAGLVAAGGSALNHLLERRPDARMRRTANRPLPAGRVHPAEAATFGLSLAVGGITYLLAFSTPAAAVAATATAALYVGVYTPLKRLSAWNTVVGAVPGALPPVIGWCAARGDLSAEGLALFAVLFVWQLPHFYSIAWMHRDDYARGGMRMLPVVDRPDGRRTGRATALTCGLLVVASLAPVPFLAGAAGWVYATGATALSLWFLARSVRFAMRRTHPNARSVLRGSLVHLVGVMGLLVATGVAPKLLSWGGG